jgi:hypothetical protein
MITYDAILDLQTALSCDWGDACTPCVGTAPTVDLVWDKKVVGFDGDVSERIIITPLNETIDPFDLFGKAHWHELAVKIDVRTYQSGGITRQNIVVKEVSRILKNIIRRNVQGFLQVIITKSETRNQDYRNMFRHLIDLKYQDAQTHTFV